MPEWKIGDRIGNRYEIHRILKGGMGDVYVCIYANIPFALKTLQDRYLESQQMRERFIREAETWVALENHPNIVKAMWVQNIQGKPYICLEYIYNPEIGGANLGRWIRQGMEVPQVLNFAVQFCDGMDYAYKKVGMVHRDIKPENILVSEFRTVKITDFGLVKTVFEEATGEDFLKTAGDEVVSDGVAFTRTGAVMGTPPYMSPEQCRNAAEVDIRSDIYAFGTVLYEMLTGRWVFKATTVANFLRCHCYESPPSPCSVVPDLPENLEAVVLRCLTKNPEERYPDFAALRTELARTYHTLTGEELAPPVGGMALEVWEWDYKGRSLATLGQPEEALACFDRALAINHRYDWIWLDKGNLLAALGRPEEALACYDCALSIRSDKASHWYRKGASLAALGQPEEALACFDRALALDPRLAQAWDDKGVCLSAFGRREEALDCYERALEIDPRHVNTWYNKGNVLDDLGWREEALTCYDRALETDPRHVKAWNNKGVSLVALERHAEALLCYDRALEIDPRFVEAWDGKGVCLSAFGRKEEALACYDRALALDPRDAKAWYNKGSNLDDLGRREEALTCYDRALAINPGYGSAWNNKGVIFGNSGRFREALDCFTKALETDPDNENAKQAIALCQQYLKQG